MLVLPDDGRMHFGVHGGVKLSRGRVIEQIGQHVRPQKVAPARVKPSGRIGVKMVLTCSIDRVMDDVLC